LSSLLDQLAAGGGSSGDASGQPTGRAGSFKRIYATSRASTERNPHLVSGNEIVCGALAQSPRDE